MIANSLNTKEKFDLEILLLFFFVHSSFGREQAILTRDARRDNESVNMFKEVGYVSTGLHIVG